MRMLIFAHEEPYESGNGCKEPRHRLQQAPSLSSRGSEKVGIGWCLLCNPCVHYCWTQWYIMSWWGHHSRVGLEYTSSYPICNDHYNRVIQRIMPLCTRYYMQGVLPQGYGLQEDVLVSYLLIRKNDRQGRYTRYPTKTQSKTTCV